MESSFFRPIAQVDFPVALLSAPFEKNGEAAGSASSFLQLLRECLAHSEALMSTKYQEACLLPLLRGLRHENV